MGLDDPNLVSGNYDTIMAGMSITPERDDAIDLTQQYFPSAPSAYMALTEDADVTGGTVAAQANPIQAAHVAESGASLLEFTTPGETIAAVRNGEADAVFADHEFLESIVEDSCGRLRFVGEPVLIGEGIGMGVRESDVDLRDKFDAAITAMKEDGSLNELILKWFDEGTHTY